MIRARKELISILIDIDYTCYMGKHFFDFEDGDFAHSISDNMAIDSDGDLLMRMGDNMAMDMDSGELHIISGWSNDEDEN